MNHALYLAKRAFKRNEVPVGALVVNQQGAIIGRGYNQVMRRCSQAAHAEMLALTQASKKQGDWRLNDCWMYVTLEPCPLCINLATLSRVSGIIFGAKSPLFGYQQHEPLDNRGGLPLYKIDTITIVGGLKEEESSNMLKQFFRQKREATSG